MSELENSEQPAAAFSSELKGATNGGQDSCESPDNMKDRFDLAAVYVSDAQHNRNITFDASPPSVRLYLIYNHWMLHVLVYVFILVDLALALFEEPALIPLPVWATSMIELICLVAFAVRLAHFAKVVPRRIFLRDPKNICIIVIITLCLLDMIIYGALKVSGNYAVRWSRVLRPLLLVNVTEGRQLRRAFRSIRNALPQILVLFFLFMFSVLIFSLMALKLMGKRNLETIEGAPYFTNYLDIVFDLYVLVTTANSPDIMMPAYNYSSFFALFFILYIVINTYTFMSVFLAVVYNNYKKYLKEEVRQLVRAKRQKMCHAFSLLKEGGEEPVVSKAHWNRLVRLVQPDITNAHRELLWNVSDHHNRGHIGKVAFVQLADLLNIQVITLKSRAHPLHTWIPAIYESAVSKLICRMVRHRMFVYLYDAIILVNAVFIGLDEEDPVVSSAEWFFLTLYVLEILLKLYTFEPRTFFARHHFWNWFDTIIIVSALLATVINAALKSSGGYTSRQILDIVFILRVLRLIRVVDSIQRFRAIINTLIKIGPLMLTFGQLILVVYYIFAMVGMELFKGKVQFFSADSPDPAREYCGNALLKDTLFARNNYCKNNFNDVVSSFVLLLELTVVNQWHVLAGGFASVTHVSARIFFVLFHIVVVIIIMNIFVAFILEAFIIEYIVEKNDLQTSLEKKIEELNLCVEQDHLDGNLVDAMETQDNDMGPADTPSTKPTIMFKISSKRYSTMDGLLQRMFETGTDLSAEVIADTSEDMNFSNPSFSPA
ncbi:two pore segment channel 3 isoform X1 [Electrophorus electricus]|uniref:two pore segment channel 3 isoform X1 n=1 Tax=Electrophorus electricus TaxID=8005 RepID=UPI0015D08FF4|nr:two pore segment channel 3 isoform X1 [Electrophorus electricus]